MSHGDKPSRTLAGYSTTLSNVDRRLTLGFGGLILALMVVVLLSGGLYLKQVMEAEEERLSTLLTEILSNAVSRVSFSGKYHARLLLEELQQGQPSISYLLLADPQGRVLAHSETRRNDTLLDADTRELIRQVLDSGEQHSRQVVLHGEPLRVITLPYRGGYDHAVLGIIQIGLSTRERDADLRTGLLFTALLVLGLMAIGMLITQRLGHHFGLPVRNLANDMAATLHAIPDLLFEIDADGVFLQVLAHHPEQLPASRERLLGHKLAEVLPQGAAQVLREALDEAEQKGESHGHHLRLTIADEERWFELSVARKSNDGIARFIVLARDTTERQRTQHQLLLAASVFDNSREGVLVTDAEQRILRVNPAFCRLTGYAAEEVIGRTPSILQSGHQPSDFYRDMWQELNRHGHWQGEVLDRCKGGSLIPILLSISAVHDDTGAILHYVAVHTDISQLKKTEEELEYQAHHDPLTGLSNRLLLHLRLEHALARARRDKGRLALLMLDLDRFKDVNDSFGHLMGDMLLREVAERLRKRTRSADTTSRLGGDEFTILLESISGADDASHYAQSLIELLNQPIRLPNGAEVSVGVTIGIALFPEHGSNEELLLQGADTALYQAKSEGRGRYKFFSDALTEAARERLAMETRLRHALDRHELHLHFQPQYPVNGGPPIGAEALLRWESSEGPVSPARFIPIAEHSGLIERIGDWVLRETCRLGAEWLQQGLPPIHLAVNVSPVQFLSDSFVERVRATLSESGFPPHLLELEITESALMSNEESGLETLAELRALGLRLAIDDFGTGYSSLAYLKRFPLDLLKIDKTFIDDIPRLRDDMEITATIIGMARTLRLEVLAEGVETEAQLAFLAAHGCDFFQGYLRSRPLPVAAFTELLRNAQ